MRRSAICFAAVLLIALSTGPARTQERSLGAVVTPVRLVPNSSEPIVVGGRPYLGTIELTSASDGIVFSNVLSMERYLLGLAEVPTEWPEEALRAQAIAARTYAAYTLSRPAAGAAATYGFDICASVLCQVFSGAEVVRSEGGARWAAAVRSTAGRIVTYNGAPILARYHSTSGGQTLDNPDAFPGESSYPYLRSVVSPWEERSPLFRWTVTFRMEELQRMLVRAGLWPAGVRLRSVRTVTSSSGEHYPDVALAGGGRSARPSAEQVRVALRTIAPDMFPDRFPSAAPTTSGRLPETFPSNRLRAFTRDAAAVFVGNGWGHGVGMSQWGAFGLAQRGASSLDILSHYYRGTRVEPAELPPRIEVGVDWGMSSIAASGSFRILDGRGRTLVRRALGTWDFAFAGTGALAIDPPRGYGLPLEIGIVKAPKRVAIGDSAFITVALSRPAHVRTLTPDAPTGFRDQGSRVEEAGRRRLAWLAPLEPGNYEIVVEASTGARARRSEPVSIAVHEPPAVDDAAADEPATTEGDGPPWPWIALVAGALVAMGIGVAAGRMRS